MTSRRPVPGCQTVCLLVLFSNTLYLARCSFSFNLHKSVENQEGTEEGVSMEIMSTVQAIEKNVCKMAEILIEG